LKTYRASNIAAQVLFTSRRMQTLQPVTSEVTCANIFLNVQTLRQTRFWVAWGLCRYPVALH